MGGGRVGGGGGEGGRVDVVLLFHVILKIEEAN